MREIKSFFDVYQKIHAISKALKGGRVSYRTWIKPDTALFGWLEDGSLRLKLVEVIIAMKYEQIGRHRERQTLARKGEKEESSDRSVFLPSLRSFGLQNSHLICTLPAVTCIAPSKASWAPSEIVCKNFRFTLCRKLVSKWIPRTILRASSKNCNIESIMAKGGSIADRWRRRWKANEANLLSSVFCMEVDCRPDTRQNLGKIFF